MNLIINALLDANADRKLGTSPDSEYCPICSWFGFLYQELSLLSLASFLLVSVNSASWIGHKKINQHSLWDFFKRLNIIGDLTAPAPTTVLIDTSFGQLPLHSVWFRLVYIVIGCVHTERVQGFVFQFQFADNSLLIVDQSNYTLTSPSLLLLPPQQLMQRSKLFRSGVQTLLAWESLVPFLIWTWRNQKKDQNEKATFCSLFNYLHVYVQCRIFTPH